MKPSTKGVHKNLAALEIKALRDRHGPKVYPVAAALAVWQKIAKASAANRGVRLGAHEVKQLWKDGE